jgi:hypothetical protein
MVTKTVAIYTFFDDLLKSMNYKEEKTRKVSDCEVITVVLPAAGYLGGNIEKTISFVRSTGMRPRLLSKSRFNRRRASNRRTSERTFPSYRRSRQIYEYQFYILYRQFFGSRLP